MVRAGKGSKLAELTPEEIQESGDHEILNWIIALGVLGDVPAEIVDVRGVQHPAGVPRGRHLELTTRSAANQRPRSAALPV